MELWFIELRILHERNNVIIVLSEYLENAGKDGCKFIIIFFLKDFKDEFHFIWIVGFVWYKIVCVHVIVDDAFILFKWIGTKKLKQLSNCVGVVLHFSLDVQQLDYLIKDIDIGFDLHDIGEIFKVMKKIFDLLIDKLIDLPYD